MIQEVFIQDFAIISKLNVTFKEGMTVLTGETGAGKSIIIDAMGLLVGARGSADYIREGQDKCRIEGSFFVEHEEKLKAYLEEKGVEMSDRVVTIQREIFQNGRNNCRINGQLVNNKILKEAGQLLVDIQGQHEHQELMDPNRHLSLLDNYLSSTITPILEQYQIHYKAYHKLQTNIKRFYDHENEFAQRLDMLQFQYDEIEAAQLTMGEEETLIDEQKKCLNFQRITETLKNTYHYLNGQEYHALDTIGKAMDEIAGIEELDASYKETYELIQNGYYSLQEAYQNVTNSMDNLDLNEERVEEVENRLDVIRQLKRKYGKTIDDILVYFEEIKKELADASSEKTDINQLESKFTKEKETLEQLSATLSQERKATALQLEADILKELKSLYMENTRFKVTFKESEHFLTTGKDKVEFFISANVGEELKPLAKVVSGGELSRVMLAIKTIFSKSQETTSIIFDEVDTGVSGRVAQAIAEKIHQIGENSQVLCITHLPQVAAISDTQYFIKKEIKDNRTETVIKELNKNERINEIARMLSGSEVTPLTIEHAKELLSLAHKN